MSVLTKDEDRVVRELWSIRDKAHKAHKWTAKQKQRANHLKDWLQSQEVAIQKAARKPKVRGGGWNRRHRAGRFQIIHLTRLKEHAGRPSVWDQSGSLRERAWKIAKTQVGVTEHGGNNMGAKVYQYIRENGGGGPEPWCGDFVAFCYRHAGSKRVVRGWAMALFTGPGRLTIRNPKQGHIVEYGFGHTGLFGRFVSSSTIDAIEGNTGSTGAVSDSGSGDGVHEKHRATSLVARYQRVLG